MYTGYLSDTMVNNIFAYGPNGKVFLCAINFPGNILIGPISQKQARRLANNLWPYILRLSSVYVSLHQAQCWEAAACNSKHCFNP